MLFLYFAFCSLKIGQKVALNPSERKKSRNAIEQNKKPTK